MTTSIVFNTSCDDDNIGKNGCFNKFPLRITKCSKIEDFFNDDVNKQTLDKWTDFQSECKNRLL